MFLKVGLLNMDEPNFWLSEYKISQMIHWLIFVCISFEMLRNETFGGNFQMEYKGAFLDKVFYFFLHES